MDVSTARAHRPRCRPPASALSRAGLTLLLLLLVARPGHAAEPLLTVSKNMLLGGATGLVLGGTLTLVVAEDERSDVVRWGAVIGTFSGFTLGVLLALRGEEDLFSETSPAAAQPSSSAGLGSLPALALARARPGPAPRAPDDREARGRQPGGWGVRMTLLRCNW